MQELVNKSKALPLLPLTSYNEDDAEWEGQEARNRIGYTEQVASFLSSFLVIPF